MSKLTDTQLVILSAASRRVDHGVDPLSHYSLPHRSRGLRADPQLFQPAAGRGEPVSGRDSAEADAD
jgi:hypothetical protein